MQSGKLSEQVATSLSSLAKSFIESEKNSNNIVDIIEHLQVSWKIRLAKSSYLCDDDAESL